MDRPAPPRPAIVVHGGAWDVPDDAWDDHRRGVTRATDAGWDVLARGGSALDAVEAAILLMEDDPTFDAGTGSVLNRDGRVEMDAALMDGRDLGVGAVACVNEVRNPIRLARAVLGTDHVLLVGEGAHRFARERGVPTCDPAELVLDRERERLTRWLAEHGGDARPAFEASGPAPRPPAGPADTVGAVAIDALGDIAAGGSTGGTPAKHPGRVGDTPVAGAGLFADNRCGAAACTGWGEGILRFGLARTAVELLRAANAQDAAWLSVRGMEDRVKGRGGVVVLSRDGSIGFAFNTPRMAVAYRDGEMGCPFVIGEGR